MHIQDNFMVCRTGKLEQFYTLYIERTIAAKHFQQTVCYFVQNLSHDYNEAVAKTHEMMAERKAASSSTDYIQNIDSYNSKQKEYCDLKAYGYAWKKTAKGFCVKIDSMTQTQSQGFWDNWRSNKDLLKKAGFSVFKNDCGFILFFKNCSSDEMGKKLELLKNDIKEKVTVGEYVGIKGERIKDIETSILKVKEIATQYGVTKIVTFDGGLISFYSGKKQLPDVGQSISLTGTVKCHKEYNGVKQTILNRINWK